MKTEPRKRTEPNPNQFSDFPVELEPEDAGRKPVGQRIDVLAAGGEDQQAKENIERGHRNDDGGDAQCLDE